MSGAQWVIETNEGAKWNDDQVEWGDWRAPREWCDLYVMQIIVLYSL